MRAQTTKLQAAEEELKRLMAEVTRATEKVQDAIARVATKSADAAQLPPHAQPGTPS